MTGRNQASGRNGQTLFGSTLRRPGGGWGGGGGGGGGGMRGDGIIRMGISESACILILIPSVMTGPP